MSENKLFTGGDWYVTHWERNEHGGIGCIKTTPHVIYYKGDSVHSNYYGIRSKIDPLKHSIQGSFEGAHIADVPDFIHQDGGAQSLANACLMAASKDLLEALQELIDTTENCSNGNSGFTVGETYEAEFAKAKAAIKKALNQ